MLKSLRLCTPHSNGRKACRKDNPTPIRSQQTRGAVARETDSPHDVGWISGRIRHFAAFMAIHHGRSKRTLITSKTQQTRAFCVSISPRLFNAATFSSTSFRSASRARESSFIEEGPTSSRCSINAHRCGVIVENSWLSELNVKKPVNSDVGLFAMRQENRCPMSVTASSLSSLVAMPINAVFILASWKPSERLITVFV